MLPDAAVLIASVVMIIIDEPIYAKYFELIRILHYNKTLYPVNLAIQTYLNSGQKRVGEI